MDARNPRRMKFMQQGFLLLTETTGLARETEHNRSYVGKWSKCMRKTEHIWTAAAVHV